MLFKVQSYKHLLIVSNTFKTGNNMAQMANGEKFASIHTSISESISGGLS